MTEELVNLSNYEIFVIGLFAAWFLGLNLVATINALIATVKRGSKGHDAYQAWWVGICGPVIVVIALISHYSGTSVPGPPLIVFLAVALVTIPLEEAIAWKLKIGAFQSPGRVFDQFSMAFIGLFLASAGAYVAYFRLELNLVSAILLFGFAGYLLEVFPFQKLYRVVPPRLLYGAYPPIVAGHYILLLLPAYVLAQSEVEGTSRWDHPLKWVLGLGLPFLFPGLVVFLSVVSSRIKRLSGGQGR